MEQGEAQDIRDAVTHATDHLRTALNASLGEIAGGDGDDVTNEVEKLRNELLTPTSDKPRGAYTEALQAEQSLCDALAAVDADLLTYRQKVDRLAQLRREHETDAGERPWEALRAQANAAGDALREAQSLQQQLDGEQNAVLALAQRIDLLRRQLDGYAAESHDAERRADAVIAAQRALDDANGLAAPGSSASATPSCATKRRVDTLALARARRQPTRTDARTGRPAPQGRYGRCRAGAGRGRTGATAGPASRGSCLRDHCRRLRRAARTGTADPRTGHPPQLRSPPDSASRSTPGRNCASATKRSAATANASCWRQPR
jgi:hypothetical protein